MSDAPAVSSATLQALLTEPTAFFARYQPIVNLRTGAVAAQAASVCARMGARLMEPQALFALVPDDETLVALDRAGRQAALRDAASWLGDQLLVLRLMADVVPDVRLALAGLADDLAASGLAAAQVVVEIGFTAARDPLSHLARVAIHCRGIGCQVGLVDVPDAATMRRSASMLTPDVVKPGRWLLDAGAEDEARATVEAIHDAGARVVAFGIEDEGDAERARTLNADWGQGWHFGRPREVRSP